MKSRKGDWRDLLAAHSLAIDMKKLWLGLMVSLATIGLLSVVAMVYGWCFPGSSIGRLGRLDSSTNLVFIFLTGQGLPALRQLVPLFNPFHGNLIHLLLSVAFYVLLLLVWTYSGGAITRLTALQYGRDDIPTLKDGLRMARAKRKAYLFAPLTPLIGLFLFAFGNVLIGLIGSIPVVGPWIMAILLPILSVPATIVLVFIAVLAGLTFGLMLPAISIGGKDAFEGWSSAYSYLLWGFNRFVFYTVLAGVIGVLTTIGVWLVAELFIYAFVKTVGYGLVGVSLIRYTGGGGWAANIHPVGGSVGLSVASWVAVLIAFLARCLVMGYVVSYFFTANTVICFLLRKHVDRIDVDEVYTEETEEEEIPEEAGPVPEVASPEGEPEAPWAQEPEGGEERPEEPEPDPEQEEDTQQQ